MMNWVPAFNALAMLIIANLLPWGAGRLYRTRCSWPLDFGMTLWDGRRLLGDHKTWRGLLVAVTGCSVAAALLQLPWSLGAQFGLLSMVGDSLSSAWKRRWGDKPGQEVWGVDQLPEALLPLVILRSALHLGWIEIAGVTALFAVLDIFSARARHPRRLEASS